MSSADQSPARESRKGAGRAVGNVHFLLVVAIALG